jgi:hypothetical protein
LAGKNDTTEPRDYEIVDDQKEIWEFLREETLAFKRRVQYGYGRKEILQIFQDELDADVSERLSDDDDYDSSGEYVDNEEVNYTARDEDNRYYEGRRRVAIIAANHTYGLDFKYDHSSKMIDFHTACSILRLPELEDALDPSEESISEFSEENSESSNENSEGSGDSASEISYESSEESDEME